MRKLVLASLILDGFGTASCGPVRPRAKLWLLGPVAASLVCCDFLGSKSANADVFVGPTTSSNRLVVAQGEAVVFVPAQDSDLSARLLVNGKTNDVEFNKCCREHAIVGPAELILQRERVLNYVRLQTNAIRSVIVPTATTNTLIVPPGRTIKFFSPMDWTRVSIQTASGTETINDTEVYLREITGPATIKVASVRSADITASQFSYYFTDEFSFPPESFPWFTFGNGKLQVTIETSTNLAVWVPHAVFRTSDAVNKFFRLRIQQAK